jgi:O-antigen/teichoic acid export membrane protein
VADPTDIPSVAPAPAASRSLFVNTLYAVGGTGFFHVCHLGVVVVLTKFSTPELTGQYFFALALVTPVVLLLGLELRAALVSDAGNQFTVGAYLKLRKRMLWLAAGVLAVLAAWRAVADPRLDMLLILVGVFAARVAWSLAEVGWGTYQRRERLDLMAGSYVLRGLAALWPFLLLLLPAARGHAGPVTAAAVLLYALGVGLVYVLFDRRRIRDRALWDLSHTGSALRALAWQTLPLGLVACIVNLCDSFPRWIFESPRVADGVAQLGYFGPLAYVTMVGNLIVIQSTTAAANRLALYYQRDRRAFLRLGGRLTGLALGIGVATLVLALFFSRPFLEFLYTARYARFETEFQLIVLANCLALLTNVFGAAATQMRIFWVQVPIQIITLIATVIAALWLIPGAQPVLGAAQTALVRAVTQLVLYAGCAVFGVVARERLLKLPGRGAQTPPE